MRFIYEGRDITEYSDDISVLSAVHRDLSRGFYDMTEIMLDNSAAWYGWKPKTGDRIRMTHMGYDTGEMYIDDICPTEGKYIIRATAIKPYSRMKRYRSWENATLDRIVSDCANEMGMETAWYNTDWNIAYRYITREHETPMAFLERILRREGAYVKLFNGTLRIIDAGYAFNRNARQTMVIDAERKDLEYDKRERKRLSALTIYSGDISATARDTKADFNEERVYMPIADYAQAGRWARGIMTLGNALSERAGFKTEFNGAYTALERIDITGGTAADGEWVIDAVTHDFINETSDVELMRVINGII